MAGDGQLAPKTMTAEHKKALAEGRNEGRAVKAYLDALEQHRPRRGRRRTTESVKKRLVAIEKALGDASSLKRLQLAQERRDLETELAGMGETFDLSTVEAEFVKVAGAYGKRKGIAYATWRELGVAAEVLKKAGITRGD
jgi:hypothetical protein